MTRPKNQRLSEAWCNQEKRQASEVARYVKSINAQAEEGARSGNTKGTTQADHGGKWLTPPPYIPTTHDNKKKGKQSQPEKKEKKSTQRDPRPNASILCSFLFSAARPQPLPTNRRCPRLACRLPAPALSMRQPRSVHFRSIRWRLLTNRFDIALCPGNARPGTRARTNASYRLSLHNTAL